MAVHLVAHAGDRPRRDWVRGVYVVKLVRDDGYQRYVPFFVRDAKPRSEVAVLIPTATWAGVQHLGRHEPLRRQAAA